MSTNINNQLNANQKTAYIFSLESLSKELQFKLKKTLDDYEFSDTKSLPSYLVAANDLGAVRLIIKDLGIQAEVTIKNIKGKSYIILKGRPGSRNILNGTRYLANNPKILKMAIGTKAVNRSIIKGGLITLVIAVPLSIADVCLQDNFTMGRLFGTIASDLSKILISSGAASLAAFAVGAVTTVAAGPLIAAIFVGVAIGITLEAIDQRFGVTEKLIKAIENEMNTLYERTFGELKREIKRVETILEYQSNNSLPIGQGLFY